MGIHRRHAKSSICRRKRDTLLFLFVLTGEWCKHMSILDDLASGLSQYWDSMIISTIIVTGAIIIYFIMRYFLSRAARSLNLDKTQLKGVSSIVKLVLIVVTIAAIIFQFSTMSGIAASAISVAAGTVIGFSSRNTISNAIAGILLLSSKPFKIGDRIRTTEDESLIGDVIEITIIYTKIKTIRNELVTIPNQTLLENQIVNYSGLDMLATVVEVSVGYDVDKDRVKSLLIEAAGQTAGIIPRPPSYVLMTRLDSFSAVYELRAYTDRPNEFLKIQSDVRENVYSVFKKAGIDLTTPDVLKRLDSAYGQKYRMGQGPPKVRSTENADALTD